MKLLIRNPSSSFSSISSGTLNPGADVGSRWPARLTLRLTENRFLRNVVSNAGGNALNSVLQLGLLLLLSRMLGSATYAAWLTAGSIIAIGECASDFGTRLWAVRSFASFTDARSTGARDSGARFSDARTVLRQCVWNKLFYTACAVAVLSLLPLNTLAPVELLLAIAVAATQPSTDPLLWFLRGKDRLDIEAALVLSARLGMVSLVIAAGWFALPLPWLLSCWVLCNLSRMVATFRLAICDPLRADLRRRPMGDLRSIRQGIVDVFPIGVSFVMAPFFTQAALLTLSIQGSDHDVNVFGTAFKLVIAAGFVGTSVVVSSFARLSAAAKEHDVERVQKIVNQKCGLLNKVMLPVCLIGIALAVPVANLILTTELTAVGTAMILLIPGLYLSCVNMAGKYTLNACGRNWLDVVSMLIGFAAFAVTYAVLTGFETNLVEPFNGMSPVWLAAACWTVSELVVLACRMFFVSQRSLDGKAESDRPSRQVVFPVRSIVLVTVVLLTASGTVFAWDQGLLSNILLTETL